MTTKRPAATKNGLQQDTYIDPDLVKAALAAAAMMIVAQEYGANALPVVYRVYGTRQSGVSHWLASWLFEPDSPEIDAAAENAIIIIGQEIGLGFRDGISLTEMMMRLEARPDLMFDETKDLMMLIVAVLEEADIVAHYARDLIAQATGRDYEFVIDVFPTVVFNKK
jgi:hypothetical protein